MARDVKFHKEDGSFKLRVCGIIKVDDKYLISNCDNCVFWGFPGGHVEVGENTEQAVLREVLEETKFDCKILKTLANIQLFFKREDGMPFHEIGYYYLLEPKNKIAAQNFSYEEDDKGTIRHHDFKWVTLDELLKMDVRPNDLKKILKEGLERQFIMHYQESF